MGVRRKLVEMRWRVLVAMLFFVGCTRSVENVALFSTHEFVTPFEDGVTIRWREEDDGHEFAYRVRRIRQGYEVYGETYLEHSFELVAIGVTPEDDYVVQYFLPNEDMGTFYYGFLWRGADGMYHAARARYDRLSRGALMRDYRVRLYPEVQSAGNVE